jgi:hypothetical protein
MVAGPLARAAMSSAQASPMPVTRPGVFGARVTKLSLLKRSLVLVARIVDVSAPAMTEVFFRRGLLRASRGLLQTAVRHTVRLVRRGLFVGLAASLAAVGHSIACCSLFSHARAADVAGSLKAIHEQAQELRKGTPPQLPKMEALRLKRFSLLGRAAKQSAVADGREIASEDKPEGGEESEVSAKAEGNVVANPSLWVGGMQAIQKSDGLIARMRYIDAFVAAHFGWEPFATIDDRMVFGDLSAQLFKSWQAAATFDPDFWERSDDIAAAYVRHGIGVAARQTPENGERLFNVWSREVQRNPDAWRVDGDEPSLTSRVQQVLEKHYSGDPGRVKSLLNVWQAAMRGSDLFAKAWQSPKAFDAEFDVKQIVRGALEKAVSNDPCHLEVVTMLAFLEKPEPSESFQPAELRESLRKRNQKLLKLESEKQADAVSGTGVTVQDRATENVMPWEAPVEYLKAKSTSFILDDLKYYTGFLDEQSPLIGTDRRGEYFSVVMEGMLLVYADDNRSQKPVVARYLAEEQRWQKLQLKLLRVGPPRRRTKKPTNQDAQGVLFDSKKVENRAGALLDGTRRELASAIRQEVISTASLFPSTKGNKKLGEKIQADLEVQFREGDTSDIVGLLRGIANNYDNVANAYPGLYDAEVEKAQDTLAKLQDKWKQFTDLVEKIRPSRTAVPTAGAAGIFPEDDSRYVEQMAAWRMLEKTFSEYLRFEEPAVAVGMPAAPVPGAVKPPAGPQKIAAIAPPAAAEKSPEESLDASALINLYGSLAWFKMRADQLSKSKTGLVPNNFGPDVANRLKERSLDLSKAADRAKFRNMTFSSSVYDLQAALLRCDILDELDRFLDVFNTAASRSQPFAVSLSELNTAYNHSRQYDNLRREDSTVLYSDSDGDRFQLDRVGSYNANVARVYLKMQRQFAESFRDVDAVKPVLIDENEWAVVSALEKYRLVPDDSVGMAIDDIDLTTILQTLPKLAVAEGTVIETHLASLSEERVAGAGKRADKLIPVDAHVTFGGLFSHPLGTLEDKQVAGQSALKLNPERIGEAFFVVLEPMADDPANPFEPEFLTDDAGERKWLSLVVPGKDKMVDFVAKLPRRDEDAAVPAMVAQFVRDDDKGDVLGIVPLRGLQQRGEGAPRIINVTSRNHEISRMPSGNGSTHFFKIVAREVDGTGMQLDDRQVNYYKEDWRDLDNNMVNDFLKGMADVHPAIPAWLLFRQELLRPSPDDNFVWAEVIVK